MSTTILDIIESHIYEISTPEQYENRMNELAKLEAKLLAITDEA